MYASAWMFPPGSCAMNGFWGGRSALTGCGVATEPTKPGWLCGRGSDGIGVAAVDAVAAALTRQLRPARDTTTAVRRRSMGPLRVGVLLTNDAAPSRFRIGATWSDASTVRQ